MSKTRAALLILTAVPIGALFGWLLADKIVGPPVGPGGIVTQFLLLTFAAMGAAAANSWLTSVLLWKKPPRVAWAVSVQSTLIVASVTLGYAGAR